jgi:TIR domain
VPRKNTIRVFVSYSRHDEELVKPLSSLLGVASNEAIFLDVESLEPGDHWEKEIIAAIKQSSVFILCWCCAGKKSEFIAKEISAALRDKKKKLVPVLFCSTALPRKIADRQWIDLRKQIRHACDPQHPSDSAAEPVSAPPRSSYGPYQSGGGGDFQGWPRYNRDSYTDGRANEQHSYRDHSADYRLRREYRSMPGNFPSAGDPSYAPLPRSSGGGCGVGLLLFAILALIAGFIAVPLYLSRHGHGQAFRAAGYAAAVLALASLAWRFFRRGFRQPSEDRDREAMNISLRAESYFRGLGKTQS